MSLDGHYRLIQPEEGMQGWLFRRDPAARPPNGTRVTITSASHMLAWVLYTTRYGESWEKREFLSKIDCGREWQTASGRWIPESDPRVRRWLLKAIADIRAGGTRITASPNPEYRESLAKEFEWVLRRNGWPVSPL